MGFGVRGGVGPFRAGVGTNGVSGGVGPLSAWTGWGGRKRPAGDGGGCLALVATFLIIWVGILAWQFVPTLVWILGVGLAVVIGGFLLLMALDKPLGALLRRMESRAGSAMGLDATPGTGEIRRDLDVSAAAAEATGSETPQVPSDITYGGKADVALAKAWPGLWQHLDDGEAVRAAFRVNGTKPMVDLVVITNERLLAVPVPANKPPKISIALDAIEGFTVSKMTDTILLMVASGEKVSIGYLKPSSDIALFKTFVATGEPT